MKTGSMMKKILLALALAGVLVCGAACGGDSEKPSDNDPPPQAETDDPALDVYEGDGTVPYDVTLFNEYAHDHPFVNTATEKGLQMETYANMKTPCSKQRFPIENGQKVSITFSVPVYEEGTDTFIDTGTAIRTQRVVDLMFRGQNASAPILQVRLWGQGTKLTTARVVCGRNGWSAAYDSSFGQANKGDGNTVYPYADTTHKVSGTMHASSSFTFVLDSENMLSTYVDGDTTELMPLLDLEKPAEKAVYDTFKEYFAETKSVSIIIRLSGKTHENLVSEGITDREAAGCIVISELCGQSLCTAGSRIEDTAAPYVSDPVLIEGGTLAAYNSYTLEIKQNEGLAPANSTVIYSNYSTDVLCYSTLESWLKITYPDGTASNIRGLKFSTKEAGTYKIAVTVRDGAFRTYTSNELVVQVKDTYRINIEGSIPETAKKGSSLTIPTAYVTNTEGSRTDANGNAYPCEVEVRNPVDVPVEIVDGKVTFDRTGQYIIRYTSVSADGTDRKEFKVTVS